MAQGDVLLNDDGTVALNGAGLVRLVDASSDCACCGASAPCTDCDPGGSGAAPESAVVANVVDGTDTCSGMNGTISYDGFDDEPNYCAWRWTDFSGTTVTLRYIKNNFTGGLCSTSFIAGKFYMSLLTIPLFSDTSWEEETTGFACDPATGKVSGTHTCGATCFGSSCDGTPIVTVDP